MLHFRLSILNIDFLVNAPLSAIIFPTEIPFLASPTEVNTVRKIANYWKLLNTYSRRSDRKFMNVSLWSSLITLPEKSLKNLKIFIIKGLRQNSKKWYISNNSKDMLTPTASNRWLRWRPRGRSNSIPWCTSSHVILSLRTWHIMITILQHARNEHCSARCVCFPNMFRFSSFCFWEYIELAYIHRALKENFSVTLKSYMCFTDLLRTTCALGRNYIQKLWDLATDKVH